MEKYSPNENGIHLIYKNLGETPNEAILRFKKDNSSYENESMTYAGRLDPMAEGLLLVLSGDELNQKQKYLDLPKTYEFEVLWGFETDTNDVLGLQVESRETAAEISAPEEYGIKEFLEKSVGNFEQKYPAYSSKPVDGKPLFQWAREGKISSIDVPSHEVSVLSCGYVGRQSISKDELLDIVRNKISLVKGDFRQAEILENWKTIIKESKHSVFVVDKIKIEVTSGFYVRQFVSDMAHSFGLFATTFHIKRIKIGKYNI